MGAAERPAPVGDGLLVVDKPGEWTSHDVVARCRRLCRTRKVGHAGTLDPMATGVLVLGVGRATKLLTFLVGCDKSYRATIRLGQGTVTDDAEGEVTSTYDVTHLTDATVTEATARLTGDLAQVPSAVSAVKIDGRRAYKRVRAGEDVQLPARQVHVARFDVLAQREGLVDGQPVRDVDVAVDVSSGTYVRALARDLGRALGTGGHLVALRRTRVGRFDLEQAHPLEELEGDAGRFLLPLAEAAREAFPVRELTEQEARALGYGQRIAARSARTSDPVAAFGPDGRLVAMLDESRERVRTHVVFAAAGS
ncbi:MAG TPA: tRNA pseudouridine(55) synthase TruB [Segeticoccus sp.]|uniref:tRNA pseudouridine(55) synthase TruB n=1 Tax=Segeticoccus sp. TaxID=2706531 RepID=UPI002D7F68DD|nr:tRNA pseudouridine(55) synthase TruB [Segeticoccus sp.]HET8598837.1 tRNA pseudouridine(55) synthase TruB [Segeticoccus sp.]